MTIVIQSLMFNSLKDRKFRRFQHPLTNKSISSGIPASNGINEFPQTSILVMRR